MNNNDTYIQIKWHILYNNNNNKTKNKQKATNNKNHGDDTEMFDLVQFWYVYIIVRLWYRKIMFHNNNK